jgi:DNA polymerase III subunit epsilon
MKLLIVDTETSSLKEDAEMIELAGALFDCDSKSIIASVSTLVNAQVPNEAYFTNRISDVTLSNTSDEVTTFGLRYLYCLFAECDAVVAHYAGFDAKFLDFEGKPFLCSYEDFDFSIDSRFAKQKLSLANLAQVYEVPIVNAHRAMSDVNILCQVFSKCNDLEALIQDAMQPKILVKADVTYQERQLAKDAGFDWEKHLPKAWTKYCKSRELDNLPFHYCVLATEE